jgi:hypothetical protein
MIEVDRKPDAFEDAVQATAYIATVHVRYGELVLPQRVREHVADGDVVVHLLRGGDDVVLLPDVEPKSNVDWPDEDLPANPQPEPDAEPEQDDEPSSDAAEPMSEREADALTFVLSGLAEFEQTVFTADSQPGPAEYDVPTAPLALTGELELPTEQPTWPGDEDSEERTDLLPAVAVPDLVEDDEPGTVFSAALVAVRTPQPTKPQRGWLERRVRLAARWVLDRSWTATRIIVAATSGLVLAGAGLGYLVMAVVR